jgi:hypothetical protein
VIIYLTYINETICSHLILQWFRKPHVLEDAFWLLLHVSTLNTEEYLSYRLFWSMKVKVKFRKSFVTRSECSLYCSEKHTQVKNWLAVYRWAERKYFVRFTRQYLSKRLHFLSNEVNPSLGNNKVSNQWYRRKNVNGICLHSERHTSMPANSWYTGQLQE